jgi:hypothetical protein
MTNADNRSHVLSRKIFVGASYLGAMQMLCVSVLLLCLTTNANPYAAIPLYMESEHLGVMVTPTDARFTGSFTFHRAVTVASEQDTRAVFEIPIWFPEHNQKDKSVAAFWTVFAKDGSSTIPAKKVIWIKPEDIATMRNVLMKAIDLKVSVSGHEVPVTDFVAYSTNTIWRNFPQEMKEPGFCCLVFAFAVEPALIRNDAHLAITYRQPLSLEDNQSRLFYVPVFENLPKEISTADTNRYAIVLTAGKGCLLTVTNGSESSVVQAGQSKTLSPLHRQAIRAVVASNQSKQR